MQGGGGRASGGPPGGFRDIPVNALIPNALTVLGLSLGLTAIRLALLDRWEIAVAAIIAAGIVDGLDGRVARILKASTAFGAQLDSLSDFLCFGVAPALMLYLWALQEGRAAGWAVALIYSVCMALRLARFNAGLANPDRPAWTSKFFTGLPAPAASIVVLIPMMLSFELGDTVLRQPLLVAFHVVFVALLMVSTIPMYAGKGIRVRPDHVLPALLRKFHQAHSEGRAEVSVWGSGTPRREFLHVDDLARACLFTMQTYDAAGILNVGVGQDLSIAQLAQLIAEVVGFEGQIVYDASKPDGTPRKLLDVSRLTALGWQAKIGLRQGIEQSYAWYLEQLASQASRAS